MPFFQSTIPRQSSVVPISGTQEINFKIVVTNQGENTDDGSDADPVELSAFVIAAMESGVTSLTDLFAEYTAASPRLVVVLKNGIVLRAWILKNGADTITFSDSPKTGQHTYYRVEMAEHTDVRPLTRLLYGWVSAVTNPIYINFPLN